MAEPRFLSSTRATYDTVAAAYAERVTGLTVEAPLEVAMIEAFVSRVRASGDLRVLDVGCGPGRLTAHLSAVGLDASGIDLSPGMIAEARRLHPHLRFAVGSMTALGLPDESLGGVLAWYSIIHTPPSHLPTVLAELHRVLVPGGHLLLGFYAGTGVETLDTAYDHAIDADLHLIPPDALVGPLREVGFAVQARLLREPEGRERRPQGSVLACRA